MIDGAIYIIGASIALTGMLGILAFVTVWTIDRVLNATKMTHVLTAWYIDKSRKEREAKRNAA